MVKVYFFIVFVCLFFVISKSVLLAEDEKEVQELPKEIVLEGERNGPLIETEKAANNVELGELLRGLPGLSGSRMGGHGIEPIIRGQSKDRLHVSQNGIQTTGACPNRMDPPTSYYSSGSFDELIVLKGYKSVKYGGSNGVVLLNRKMPLFEKKIGVHGKIQSVFGSNEKNINALGDVAFGNEIWAIRGIGEFNTAGDYKDGDNKKVRSSYDSVLGSVDFRWQISEGHYLEPSFDLSKKENILYSGAGMDSPLAENKSGGLRYRADKIFDVFTDTEFNVYYSAVKHEMDNYTLRTQTAARKMFVDSETTTNGLKFNTSVYSNLMIGMEYKGIESTANRYWDLNTTSPNVLHSLLWPDVDNDEISVFAEKKTEFNDFLSMTIGLRGSYFSSGVDSKKADTNVMSTLNWQKSPNELYDLYYGKHSDSEDEFNLGGLISLDFSLSASWGMMLAVSRSLKTGNATERYLAGNHMKASDRWVGNPFIKSEQHHQIELALSNTTDNFSFEVSVFYNYVVDYILQDRARGQDGILLSDGATIYRNVDANFFGGDLSLSYQWRSLHFDLGSSMVYATNKKDDRAIAQIPPLNGHVTFRFEQKKWNIGSRLNWSSKQNHADDDPLLGGLDATNTAGWVVLNLFSSIRVGKKVEFNLGVDNLFDKAFAYHVNRANLDPFSPDAIQVNEPGLVFWGKVSYQF